MPKLDAENIYFSGGPAEVWDLGSGTRHYTVYCSIILLVVMYYVLCTWDVGRGNVGLQWVVGSGNTTDHSMDYMTSPTPTRIF